MSSVSPNFSLNPVLKTRSLITLKNLGWAIMGVLSLIILFSLEIPVLVNPNHPARPHYFAMRWPLLPHAIFGIFSILAGPVQFSSRVRRNYPKLHRVIGRLYVGSIMISAPMGAVIVLALPEDNNFRIGVCVHATLWFITTLMAFLTARNRQILQHKQWMVRSYVLTFSFIVTRILGPVWNALHISHHDYGIVDVMLNVAYLLVADIGLNWREITTKRA